MDLLTNFNVLPKRQHSFISRMSTNAYLLEWLNVWTLMFDKKKSKIYVLYIDHEEMIDSLIHEEIMFMLSKSEMGGNLLTYF